MIRAVNHGALPANIRKKVFFFNEIKCDGITSLHGFHVMLMLFLLVVVQGASGIVSSSSLL